MDVLILSRLQFAVAACFHFLFVPLTLGLSIIVAVMETVYVRTGDDDYRRMARFWGKLFLVNYAVGVVTGITLEFQFGTNWSPFSIHVGDVFGSLLAIEATVSFFLESTFIAVWLFGWKKLTPRVHALAIWLVAGASNVSAFWILAANAWMQHPVGYVVRNGRAELASFVAVVSQRGAILELAHTLGGAYILCGIFVLGVSAWHIARKREQALFAKSFRIAASWTLAFALAEIAFGHASAENLRTTQPAKLAAMESLWETSRRAPIHLVSWPDEDGARNRVEALTIPGALSLLAGLSADTEVKGLGDFAPEDRPPVLPVFLGFRTMVGLGFAFALLGAWAFLRRRKPEGDVLLLRILPWTIPLPYVAIELGWIVTEMGRQPWIVYGLMRTQDAVSTLAASQVATSLAAFFLVYSVLGAVDFYLLCRFARRGPEPRAA